MSGWNYLPPLKIYKMDVSHVASRSTISQLVKFQAHNSMGPLIFPCNSHRTLGAKSAWLIQLSCLLTNVVSTEKVCSMTDEG